MAAILADLPSMPTFKPLHEFRASVCAPFSFSLLPQAFSCFFNGAVTISPAISTKLGPLFVRTDVFDRVAPVLVNQVGMRINGH
jgi:hypothetical protein